MLEDYVAVYFFFNDTATTESYTLSLHDALPIWPVRCERHPHQACGEQQRGCPDEALSPKQVRSAAGEQGADRKSTRLNSSHANISHAVFCLKKKPKSLLQSRVSLISRSHPDAR